MRICHHFERADQTKGYLFHGFFQETGCEETHPCAVVEAPNGKVTTWFADSVVFEDAPQNGERQNTSDNRPSMQLGRVWCKG
jgi:hypothetical protein